MSWSRRKTGVVFVVAGVTVKATLVLLCWAFLRHDGPLWMFLTSHLTIIGGVTLMAALVALLILLGVVRRLALKTRPRGDSGTATIEMALVFPILLAVVLIMIQSMLVVSGNLAVHLAAYAAARSAIVWIPEYSDLEEWNVVADDPTSPIDPSTKSAKLLHVRQAAVLTLTPVSAGKPGAGGAGNALVDSQTVIAGIERYYNQSGQRTPGWVNNMLRAKLQYASEFTEVWLDAPQGPPAATSEIPVYVFDLQRVFTKNNDGQLYLSGQPGRVFGKSEDIRVHVRHRLYLSVPYACRLFGEALPNGVDYAASVQAAYSLTNQGTVDQMDEEIFPRAAS